MKHANRLHPEVLETERLLPSQRELLELQLPSPHSFNVLSRGARAKLAEFFSYEVHLLFDEVSEERGWDELDHRENRSDLEHTALALSNDYHGVSARIIDTNSTVSPYGEHQTTPPQFFTPEGIVVDPIGDFQQKLLLIELSPRMGMGQSETVFGLYTNNLAAQPPRWEYVSRSYGKRGGLPTMDMLPNHFRSDPYFMHLVPDAIQSEELADAVVAQARAVVQHDAT
jgi:hypothetical protein